jgi:hypothetical protein
MYSEYALAPPMLSDSEVATAGLLCGDPGTTDEPWYQTSLPRPDWSYTTVTTQVVPLQKASWAVASAAPPPSVPMFLVALSDERRTW